MADDGEDRGPRTFLRADGAEPVRSLFDDDGYRGQSFDVIDDRGLLVQPFFHGKGRTVPGHAPITFHRTDEDRLLAADKGAGALKYLYIKGEIAAQNVFLQQIGRPGLAKGGVDQLDRQGVFGPDIDKALAGADGPGADHHAFQNLVGVALQKRSIHVSPGVAFVGVADDDFLAGFLLSRELPFFPRGEPGAAASPQAGSGDGVDDGRRRHGQGLAQGGIPAQGKILMDFGRIDAAAFFHDKAFFPIKTGVEHDRRQGVVLFHGAVDVLQAGVPVFEKVFDQHDGLAFVDLLVHDGREPGGRGIDNHQWLGVAVPVTPDGVDNGLDVVFDKLGFKGVLGFPGAGRQSAGRHADMNFRRGRRLKFPPSGGGLFLECLVCLFYLIVILRHDALLPWPFFWRFLFG